MTAQPSTYQASNQYQFDFGMYQSQRPSAPGDDSFNVTSAPEFSFQSDPSKLTMTDNPIMWGGMEQLSLDRGISQRWPQDHSQNVFDHQMAANHISQFGQITPPNDVDHQLKLEDESNVMAQGTTDTPRASTRSKRPSSKRSSKDREDAHIEKSRKTTRKARKGYKATTVEEQNDSDGEMKRERFLERNRVAASKCRQKKKEWTNGLEGHARELAAANANLNACALSLKEEVLLLKSECLRHTDCSCTRIREYLDRSIAGMAPSNTIGMLMKPEDQDIQSYSNGSPYDLDNHASPAITSEGVDSSRHGSTSEDSPFDSQMMDDPAKVEQDMQALLEASFSGPENREPEYRTAP